MTPERYSGWQPPSKELDGEDIRKLFSMMLVNETVAMMYAKTLRPDLPIMLGIDEMIKEEDRIYENLNAKGLYFHQTKGSVFMDYKILRGEFYIKLGKDMGANDEKASETGYRVLSEMFNSDMSPEDALLLAENIVDQWNW